jgi:hypothetical protein
MRWCLAVLLVLFAAVAGGRAADREWQSGSWGKAAAPAPGAASRTYTIETDRFTLSVQAATREGPVAGATLGSPVSFAIEKNIVYVRQGQGERALRLVKRIEKFKSYSAPGGGHYIKAVSDDGLTLTLEDGSIWELDPRQQYRTAHWQPLAGITVSHIDSASLVISMMRDVQSEFDYFLNNTVEDEGTLGRLVSGP